MVNPQTKKNGCQLQEYVERCFQTQVAPDPEAPSTCSNSTVICTTYAPQIPQNAIVTSGSGICSLDSIECYCHIRLWLLLLRFHRMLLSHQALTKAQIALDLLHLISNLLSQVLTFGLDLLVEQQMAHLQPQICPPTTFRVTDTLVSHSFSNPVFHTISENPACLYHSKAILIP